MNGFPRKFKQSKIFKAVYLPFTMELGLSLGNPEKAFAFLAHQKAPTNKGTLDFCMALGLNNNNSDGVEAPEKSQDSDEAAAGGSSDEDNNSNTNTHLQLNLLSAPPLQISLPWSSDNGSSENGSSGLPAARRLNVNRIPATTKEVSSANSLGSPFGMYINGNFLGNGNKTHKNKDIQGCGCALMCVCDDVCAVLCDVEVNLLTKVCSDCHVIPKTATSADFGSNLPTLNSSGPKLPTITLWCLRVNLTPKKWTKSAFSPGDNYVHVSVL